MGGNSCFSAAAKQGNVSRISAMPASNLEALRVYNRSYFPLRALQCHPIYLLAILDMQIGIRHFYAECRQVSAVVVFRS